MIDLKGILFDNIKSRLAKSEFEIDELNVSIDLKENKGDVIGYDKDIFKFRRSLDADDLSTIQKIFINKVVTMYNKDFPDDKVVRIFLTILIDKKDYNLYLYIEGKELPIQFEF